MAQVSITFDPADVGEVEVAQRILSTLAGTNKADREFGQPHHGHDERPSDPSPAQVFGGATGPVTVVAADPTPGHPIPPAPAAPTPLPPSFPPIPPLADKDAKGVPWDARIHAASHEKNKDGTWRIKRGADKAEVARILAEITPMALPPASPPAPLPPPGVPAAPAGMPVPPVSVPPSAPVASGLPPSADAPVNPFVELMQHVMLQVRSSKITNAEVMECAAKFGIVRLDELSAKVELIPQVRAAIDAVTFGR